MTVAAWWKERLEARTPLRESLWVDGYTVRTTLERPGPWPKSVARRVLYEDYKIWFEDTFLPSYLTTQFYVDNPGKLPKKLTEMAFFTGLGPFVYLNSKKQDVKNYFVKEPRFYEGKWLQVKVRRYFVKLGTWEEHVQVFEIQERQRIRQPEKDLEYT